MPTPKMLDVQMRPDGVWSQEIQGATYIFREATGRERSRARNSAIIEAPGDPGILEHAYLASLGVIRQEQADGTFRNLTVDEIMDRGELFIARLMASYAMGLGKLQAEAKKGLTVSSTETSPMEASEQSVRP